MHLLLKILFRHEEQYSKEKIENMATWFISRHQGAIDWAKQQGISVDHWVTHLDIGKIQPGDMVIGTLPLHLAAQICEKGARLFFLTLNLNADQRGRELTAIEMAQSGCTLAEYDIKNVSSLDRCL